MILFLWGCGLKVSDLPYREYPFISELEFIKDISLKGEKILKTRFKDNQIKFPMVMVFKLNEVTGKGTLKVQIYQEDKSRVLEKDFQFGERDKYYEYIFLYHRISKLVGHKFFLTISYNEELIWADWVQVPKTSDQ